MAAHAHKLEALQDPSMRVLLLLQSCVPQYWDKALSTAGVSEDADVGQRYGPKRHHVVLYPAHHKASPTSPWCRPSWRWTLCCRGCSSPRPRRRMCWWSILACGTTTRPPTGALLPLLLEQMHVSGTQQKAPMSPGIASVQEAVLLHERREPSCQLRSEPSGCRTAGGFLGRPWQRRCGRRQACSCHARMQ